MSLRSIDYINAKFESAQKAKKKTNKQTKKQ